MWNEQRSQEGQIHDRNKWHKIKFMIFVHIQLRAFDLIVANLK